jgi:hypothetical protein
MFPLWQMIQEVKFTCDWTLASGTFEGLDFICHSEIDFSGSSWLLLRPMETEIAASEPISVN